MRGAQNLRKKGQAAADFTQLPPVGGEIRKQENLE